MLGGLIGLVLSCLVGLRTYWWLWTIEDRLQLASVPWAYLGEVDSEENYINPPYNDWTGLV